MKILKKLVMLLIVFIMLVSVLVSCAKEDVSNTTTASLETTTMKSETTTKKVETINESKINAEVGEIIQFGSYEQDNNLANGKERSDWRVLDVDNNNALLLSERILDSKPYNVELKAVTWETCTLRAWLNNNFYNTAFSSAEQARVITSTVVNTNDPFNNTSGGNITSDKLFLLSYADTINPAYGFSSSINTEDTARRAQGTDYAKSHGLWVATDDIRLGNSFWWLRSPGSRPKDASYVGTGGLVIESGFNGVGDTSVGVRPVLWINL